MANKLVFHPHIPDDVVAAVTYYEEISSELANRFWEQVNRRLDDISARPEHFQPMLLQFASLDWSDFRISSSSSSNLNSCRSSRFFTAPPTRQVGASVHWISARRFHHPRGASRSTTESTSHFGPRRKRLLTYGLTQTGPTAGGPEGLGRRPRLQFSTRVLMSRDDLFETDDPLSNRSGRPNEASPVRCASNR